MRTHSGTARHFWQDDRGFIAVLAALLIVPLMTIIALAVDFANAADARSVLNGAAEAAAITAVTEAAASVALNPRTTFEAAEAAGFARFTDKARGAGPARWIPFTSPSYAKETPSSAQRASREPTRRS